MVKQVAQIHVGMLFLALCLHLAAAAAGKLVFSAASAASSLVMARTSLSIGVVLNNLRSDVVIIRDELYFISMWCNTKNSVCLLDDSGCLGQRRYCK